MGIERSDLKAELRSETWAVIKGWQAHGTCVSHSADAPAPSAAGCKGGVIAILLQHLITQVPTESSGLVLQRSMCGAFCSHLHLMQEAEKSGAKKKVKFNSQHTFTLSTATFGNVTIEQLFI